MMSIKKTLWTLIFAIAVFPGVIFAQQTEEQVKELLEERDAQIKQLVGPEGTEYTDEQRQQLKEIINGVIDFEAMAKGALAETYDTISTEKREEFVDLFATIVRDQSLNNLDIYRADVKYTLVEVDGDEARVETLAQLKDVRTPVNYDMKYKSDEWVITDMEIDDVSTVNSYNRQFQRNIAQKGFDDLMDRLRKRAERA